MAEYLIARKKLIDVLVARWWKNGDHPEDHCDRIVNSETGEQFDSEGKIVRYYRRPDVSGTTLCACGLAMHEHGWIDTLEGGHVVCPGDWIAKGVKGEFWPIKPDVFAMSYDIITGPSPLVPASELDAAHEELAIVRERNVVLEAGNPADRAAPLAERQKGEG